MTIGLFGLIVTGQASFYFDHPASFWLTDRFQILGPGLVGLVFIVGSFAALRSRLRAGLIFLLSAPVLAFIFTYPDAGFLVWKPNGSGVFEFPLPSTAVELACIFYLPFVAPLFAIRNRKRAVILFLIPAAVAVLVFAGSRWTLALLPRLAAWSAFFLAFAAFWLGTYKLGWPTPFATGPRSLKRQLGIAFIECVSVGVLLLAGTFGLTMFQATADSIANCRGLGLFVEPLNSAHAVFTARLIWVGHRAKASGKWVGEWAIGEVQERFWGLPPQSPRFVLLTNSVFWEGATFFVSGRRQQGFLTRYLPIVEAEPCLGIAQPVSAAEIHLRVLRESSAANKVRIIGSVQSPKRPEELKQPPAKIIDQNAFLESVVNPTAKYRPLAGARISVTGPGGTKVVNTDAKGIYEIYDLPPDDYTLSLLDKPANQIAKDQKLQKKEFALGKPVQSDFILEWMAR